MPENPPATPVHDHQPMPLRSPDHVEPVLKPVTGGSDARWKRRFRQAFLPRRRSPARPIFRFWFINLCKNRLVLPPVVGDNGMKPFRADADYGSVLTPGGAAAHRLGSRAPERSRERGFGLFATVREACSRLQRIFRSAMFQPVCRVHIPSVNCPRHRSGGWR